MKSIGILSILLIFINICFSADRYIVHLHRDGVPRSSGWSIIGKAQPEDTVKYTISLQQRNLDVLESRFFTNSDPSHPDFAKHMTKEEIMDLIAPSIQVQKDVLTWIYDVAEDLPEQIINIDNEQDAIIVTSTVEFAEKLFKTELHLFHNDRNDAMVIKHLGSLSIPEMLSSHITLVTGITELYPVKIQQKKRKQDYVVEVEAIDNQCNTAYTIKRLYGIPDNLTISNMNSNISIYADISAKQHEGFGIALLDDYQTSLGYPVKNVECILGTGKSWFTSNVTDIEANLDVEMVAGIATDVDICFYIMEQGQAWMYEFTREIFNTPDATLVVSMSYGWWEEEQCMNTTYPFLGNCTYYHIPNSQKYVNLTNVNFQKLGLLGHSLIASSGDDGCAGGLPQEGGCKYMISNFPAASPYVTTVGATTVEATNTNIQNLPDYWKTVPGAPPVCTDYNTYLCNCSTSINEQPALANNSGGFDTGGGFSVYSSQPAYQKSAVQSYLNSGVTLPKNSLFNGNNRGYPDIAAIGSNFCVLNFNMECSPQDGTSASAPLIASIITLLNQDRINSGKTPLGFFNQVIYQMFAEDSTKYFNNEFPTGNNAGGSCDSSVGFNSISGYWTPLTGVGSPKFEAIREYVANLP